MNSPRTRFYRDKVNGKIMGVCAGIADYTGVDVLWIRLGAILLTLMGSGFLIPIYFLIGLLVDTKPNYLYTDVEEQQFWL